MGSLSDYEVLKPLGQGGQSRVSLVRLPERQLERSKSFKTVDEFFSRTPNQEWNLALAVALGNLARPDTPQELAALKEFVPRAPNVDAENSAEKRLQNEIKVLKTAHPGFLKLIDYNESERWIVTEFCENGTLDTKLHMFKGKAFEALSAFLPLVRSVAQLHEQKIVHRDIKPQNIFMGSKCDLLLGDFGLVFLPDQGERISGTGESVGPKDFMPPWIFLEDMPGPINPTFDVYMLGKVLWCMISGKMRLPREHHRTQNFDLARLFPDDPHMHAINFILDSTVVENEKDCKASASELLEMVEGHLRVIRRGGQMLRDGIPRFCRVCGLGQYHPALQAEGAHTTTALQFSKVVNGVMDRVGGFTMAAFSCDYCGHIQFFKTGQLR